MEAFAAEEIDHVRLLCRGLRLGKRIGRAVCEGDKSEGHVRHAYGLFFFSLLMVCLLAMHMSWRLELQLGRVFGKVPGGVRLYDAFPRRRS